MINPVYDRRKQALARQAIRDKLSNAQQLKALDFRLGKDEGAVKERKRLSQEK